MMNDKSELINKIRDQADKETNAVKAKYKALGDAFNDAWPALRREQEYISDMCQVAYELFDKGFASCVAVPTNDRNKVVMFDRTTRGTPDHPNIVPICYRAKSIMVMYFPDSGIYVADAACPSFRHEDVTIKAKEVRDILRAGEDNVIERIKDNLWVYASTIAEGISAIFKSFRVLGEQLTAVVNELGKEPEQNPDEDVFEWFGDNITYKYPRLTADEQSKIDKFVHATPPNSDCIAPIFNLLIRFARETIDDSRRNP